MSSRAAQPPAHPRADPRSDDLLVIAAEGDAARLADLRRQHDAGTPAPYLAGFILFRGHRFQIDPRAYITDPEATHLVDTVVCEGRRLAAKLARPPRLLEFGIGAGALSISLKIEQPDWSVTGLEIDPPALALARANSAAHAAPVGLIESDYFSGWPADAAPPDILFGDPPWGGPTDLYDDARDAGYYQRMPARSAFPGGDTPCSIHDELIRRLCARAWPTTLILNYGVLPLEVIGRSASPLLDWRLVHPAPRLSILIGHARA
jgi:release factor glutamine methyltransferase